LRGIDANGTEFVDLTKTLDISTTGACLASRRSLYTDQMIRITIPVSSEPISGGMVPAETPPIHARVRRVTGAGEAVLVGVEFLKALE
jgi:hypothetical protein